MRIHLGFLILTAGIAPGAERPFAIRVVDEATGRGVPLIELRTVHNVRFFTDSNGLVAFDEPALMNDTVFFTVSAHGYEFPKDGFGFRGKQLKVTPGGTATLPVKRINVAERLYRVTGAGVYRDTMLLGQKSPLREPLLNGRVLGSDSVMAAEYKGKLYWFWGDTNRASYPLGNFHVPGATSERPGKGGLDPAVGIDLTYFVDDTGFAKKTCEMPGKGPTWLTTLVPLTDRDGRERLFGSFVKIEPPLRTYNRGFCVWNDDKAVFDKVRDVDLSEPVFPMGHAVRHGDHVYFAHPFPLVRVAATAEAFSDPKQYEAFTCLEAGSTVKVPKIVRDERGRPRYRWRKDAPAIGVAEHEQLVKAGHLAADTGPTALKDRDTGRRVRAHAGSVAWNEYRRRWTLIAVEQFGTASLLGEVWYAEADSLTGPWGYAVKVVTHDKMSFYNPKQHAFFAKDGGRQVFFEGTYTHDFSGNPDTTPRYEYNQVMYRLDLGLAAVALPRPVAGANFWALDRPLPGSMPIPGLKAHMLADAKDVKIGTIPLYEFRNEAGQTRLGTAESLAGFTRSLAPIGRVWPKPGSD